VGVEALIRWMSPERGLVPPLEFILLLEETGLILEVGEWALRQAVRDHAYWTENAPHAPRVAVNVSPIQLRRPNFVEIVKEAIGRGVTPHGLDLEITESILMEEVDANIEKLRALRELGVSVAIDDFGTGYSSLGYLAKLPVQSLKIDRSFIITMLKEPGTMTLVSTVISLARSLRLAVVAEGVDSEDQANTLRLARCDQMQGYLISKAVTRDEITALLRRKETKVSKAG
jgi:EAL domain-containing protein (putative c-di-GMP-specific phosphodiesterase class I)